MKLGMTQDEIGGKYQLSKGSVVAKIKLLDLPTQVQSQIVSCLTICEKHAVEIHKLNPYTDLTLYDCCWKPARECSHKNGNRGKEVRRRITKLSQTVRNLLPHPSKEQIDILYQIAYTFFEHLEEITKAIILPSKADAFLQVASAFLFYHGQSKFRSLKQSVRKHRLDGAIS